MKPLLKYSATLFVLLLIGYSQLFAPLYRAPSSPGKRLKTSEQGSAIGIKTRDSQTVFIAEEEEDVEERACLKKVSAISACTLIHSCDDFFHFMKGHTLLYGHFTSFSFFKSPYLVFRVFRL